MSALDRVSHNINALDAQITRLVEQMARYRASQAKKEDALAVAREGLALYGIAKQRAGQPTDVRNLDDFIDLTEPPGLYADIWTHHIATLADELSIEITIGKLRTSSGVAYGDRCAYVPPPDTWRGYTIALHELGHVATYADAKTHRRVDYVGGSCSPHAEILAWDYAKAHARPRWTRDQDAIARRSLQTYVEHATEPDESAAYARWSVFENFKNAKKELSNG
jgi:hypothetical protein